MNKQLLLSLELAEKTLQQSFYLQQTLPEVSSHWRKGFFIIIIESKDQEKPLETDLEAKMFTSEKHSGSLIPLKLVTLIHMLRPLIYYFEQNVCCELFFFRWSPEVLVANIRCRLSATLVFAYLSFSIPLYLT